MSRILRQSSRSAVFTLLFAWPALAAAQSACPSVADPFGPPGTDGVVRDLVVFDDGTGAALYAGGTFGAAGLVRSTHVARFDGTSWSRVGELTPSTLQSGVRDLEAFDDGTGPRLFAAGGGIGVAGWNGQAWDSLATGLPQDLVALNALAVFDAGSGPRLYAGGSRYDTEFNEHTWLGRLEGSTWVTITGAPDFGSYYGNARILALCTYDAGNGPQLYVGGIFDGFPGSTGAPCFSLARWSGTAWSAVGPAGVGGVTLGEGVHSMCVFDDGSGPKLWFAGDFLPFWGANVRYLARWDGTSFSSISVPIQSEIERITVLPAVGDVPAGLWIAGAGDLLPSARTCVWNGSVLAPVPGCEAMTPNAMAAFDSGSGAQALIGGTFHDVAGVSAWNVARRSGGAWHSTSAGQGLALASGFNPWVGLSGVLALHVHDDGSGPALFAGGKNITHAGDRSVGSLARWNGSSWSAVGSVSGEVVALASCDFGNGMELVAAGSMQLGGIAGTRTFGRWTGAGWATLPAITDFFPKSLAVFDAGAGPQLYAGGTSNGAGLLRWNGAGWDRLASWPVWALRVQADSLGTALFVGGEHWGPGAGPSLNIMRFDGTVFSPLANGLGTSGDIVRALATFDDGHGARLIAGGRFSAVNGMPAGNVASWDGTTWTPLDVGLQSSDPFVVPVHTLAVMDEGQGFGPTLFAGGPFTASGASPIDGAARWNGSAWSEAFGGAHGLYTGVETMLAVDEPALGGRSLFLGGGFSALGDQSAALIGEIRACDATGTLTCFGDGSAAACPCGNFSAPAERAGCASSLGHGGSLRARGRPSLSADTIELQGSAMPNVGVLYFQGMSHLNGGVGVPFGDGIKCTGGPFVRLGTKTNSAGASVYPGPGDPSVSVKGMIHSPGTRHYQLRYRNAAMFCTSDTFNYTNALTLVWTP